MDYYLDYIHYWLANASSDEIAVVFVNLIILSVVLRVIVMIVQLSRNKFLGLTTKPFSKVGRGEGRVLLLGDSTAVGTGASRPEDTIAGRLAHDFPKTEIINVAQNGGLVRDLHSQITPLKEQKFDLIIVSVGGNDVWHMTRLKNILSHLEYIIPTLISMSDHKVIFLTYNNIGSAPVFPKLMRGFLKSRCIKVQNVIREATYKLKVPTIDLFTDDDHNPFIENGDELFSFDGIHPSSTGYKLWYHRMWRKMIEEGYRIH
ncbi:hypothetical protein H6785_01450 [Candidatus Nomurabacteria bacterium]|nr:hypothetical protein [Candidatus Kaiserbacteria bacterium]MCB9815233.1 hypothetical protein [Candidatus Nomurabacteria bacterium]